MDAQPILTLYRNSINGKFPLILAIGREPNTEGVIDDSVSTYDWQDARSGFWATANEVVAEVVGLEPSRYKQTCENLGASPVAISNAMPTCVPHGSGRQSEVRKATSSADVARQFRNLVKHRKVLERVRMIWLSGLGEQPYAEFVGLVQARFEEQAMIIHIPFLNNPFRPKIKAAMKQQHRTHISSIWGEFLASVK